MNIKYSICFLHMRRNDCIVHKMEKVLPSVASFKVSKRSDPHCFNKSHLKSLIEKKSCIFYLGSPYVLCRGVGIVIE